MPEPELFCLCSFGKPASLTIIITIIIIIIIPIIINITAKKAFQRLANQKSIIKIQ